MYYVFVHINTVLYLGTYIKCLASIFIFLWVDGGWNANSWPSFKCSVSPLLGPFFFISSFEFFAYVSCNNKESKYLIFQRKNSNKSGKIRMQTIQLYCKLNTKCCKCLFFLDNWGQLSLIKILISDEFSPWNHLKKCGYVSFGKEIFL